MGPIVIGLTVFWFYTFGFGTVQVISFLVALALVVTPVSEILKTMAGK